MTQFPPTIIQSEQTRFEVIRRVTLIGAAVNILLTLLKIVIGVIGQSQALIADGLHSLSDLISDGVVYLANLQSQHGPDEGHPYGHGRAETLAVLSLGVTLLCVAGFVIWDAGVRLFETQRLLQPHVSVLVTALLGLLVKEWLFRYSLRAGRAIRSKMVIANAWHHRSDAWSSLVVLIGTFGTLVSLPYLDALAAVMVGLMIGQMGWEQGWGAIQELLDAGMSADRVRRIRQLVLSVDGVRDLHMLRTRKIGEMAIADVHVLVKPRVSVSEGHMISVRVEQVLKAEFDELSDITVHIDPEDDDLVTPNFTLPLRQEIEAQLTAAWRDIPTAGVRHELVLHYLDGHVDLEVYFPCKSSMSPHDDTQRLHQAMLSALQVYPHFGNLRLYWGPLPL